jgi:hypothetical protein
MLALFFLSSTCSFAQLSKPLSGTPYGESLQSSTTSYALSQAMPMAKTLLGKKIVIVGMAANVTVVSKTPVWFMLTDGTAKCAIVNKLTTPVPSGFIGKKVGVLGTFAINSITNEMQFLATGLTVASSTESETGNQISSTGAVYGEPIPSTARTMTLTEAMQMAKSLVGSKIVVTGAASTNIASANTGAWFYLADGTVKVAVIKKITATVPAIPNGQKMALYGGFVQNPSTSAMEFHAVSLRFQ